jgi:hypothetical protein
MTLANGASKEQLSSQPTIKEARPEVPVVLDSVILSLQDTGKATRALWRNGQSCPVSEEGRLAAFAGGALPLSYLASGRQACHFGGRSDLNQVARRMLTITPAFALDPSTMKEEGGP